MRFAALLAGLILLNGVVGMVRADSQLVSQIRADLTRDPLTTVNQLNETLMARLLEAHEYQAVEEFAITGTLAVANDPARIEQLQQHRVRALLTEGKSQEALRAAKALFNVCTMHFVRETLPILCDCLHAANPGDRSLVARFKLQVLANAQEDPNERTRLAAKCGGNAVMANLAGDPEPYAAAIKRLESETDYRSVCAVANLELLSGHVGKAATLLDRAYEMAPDADLNAASEGIARKLKALDGAIGRANQFVISIRPAE
jgi:hypothetical protein